MLDELISPLPPGKHSLSLAALSLKDGSPVNIPLLVVKGARAGSNISAPKIGIVAGQHGNEWNGTYICRELFSRLDERKLKADIVMVPIANPLAFREAQRVSSIDHIDMNRVYGSLKKRKPTEHLASQLFEEVFAKCNTVFDLHSGGPGEYLPLIEVAGPERADEAAELGLPAVLVVGKHSHSLGHNLEKAGVGAFTIECGRGRDVDLDQCESVIQPIMRYLGLNGLYSYMTEENDLTPVYKHREMFGAPAAGCFFSAVQLGEQVQKGQAVGQLQDLLDTGSREIKTARTGLVTYLRREPIVSKDESLYHLIW